MVSISFALSPRRPKDTRENILATKKFTVNIISEPFIEAANSTSVESPADTDEWLISGLTMEPSVSSVKLWKFGFLMLKITPYIPDGFCKAAARS